MNPRTNYKKVSPCVLNSIASGQGLSWLTSFFSACAGGCTVDYVCVHRYGSVSDVAGLNTYASKAASQSSKPVWVSEFGFTDGSDSDKAAAIRTAISALGNNANVFRYAYFYCGRGTGLLLSSTGAKSTEESVWCSATA